MHLLVVANETVDAQPLREALRAAAVTSTSRSSRP